MTFVRPLLRARMARAVGQRAGGACSASCRNDSIGPLTATQRSRPRRADVQTALSSLVHTCEGATGATSSIDP